jgi:putative ribosome biogenesis GTPase RsgA
MKYLKTYENTIKDEPQVGDYVIIKPQFSNEKYVNYINNNIGRITKISKNNIATIFYENVPNEILIWFELGAKNIQVKTSNIIYHSKNKKNLEPFLIINKYNI